MKKILFILALSPFFALAHGDEISTGNRTTSAYFSRETVSDKYEYLLKYGELTPGKEGELLLFISDFITNLPVDSLAIAVSSPEWRDGKFEVERVQPGIYHLHAAFPEARAYTLNIQLSGGRKGADLVALAGIQPGEKLPGDAGEESPEHSHAFSGFSFVFGMLAGGFLILLVGRLLQRRLGRKAAILLLVALALPSAPALLTAHGDEEHGKKDGGALSANFLVLKETQFLFGIETDRIASGKYAAGTVLFGTVVPTANGQAVLSSPQTGTLTRLNVQVGQRVSKGQVLAVVETSLDPASAVGLASERNTLRAELEAAQKAYDRLQRIADIAAKKDLDEAKSRLDKARENLALLQSNAGRFVTLRAPIAGVVDKFAIAPGATVAAGDNLLTINAIGKVLVEAQVFDRDREALRTAQSFLAECANDDHKTARVRLVSATPTIDPTNQSQRVIFELDNPDGDFKIGEFVNIRALSPTGTAALLLPNSAITELSGKPAVFVKDAAERYSLVYVNLGGDNGTHTAVLEGVEEGERVVMRGAYQLKMVYLNQ